MADQAPARQFLTFPITCNRLGQTQIKTANWTLEQDALGTVVNFRGTCECGEEHFGFAHVTLKPRA